MKICQFEQRNSHSGPVAAVAIAGDTVITGGYDGRVGWWKRDGDELVPQRFLYLHNKGINCVAISPDGALVASGGSDGIACIIRPGEETASVAVATQAGDVESAVFTADSRFLLTGGTDGKARLFSVADGREILSVAHGKTVGALSRHPDPELLISGCNDRKLRLLRIADGAVVAEVLSHTGPVKTVGVVESGIISSGHDQSLLLHTFDLSPLGSIHRFTTTPKTIAVEPGGKHFWTGVYDQRTSRWIAGSVASEFHLQASGFNPRAWAHGLAAGEGFAVIGSFDGAPMLLLPGADDGLRATQAATPVGCISTSVIAGEGMVVAGDSGRIRLVPQSPHANAVLADATSQEIAAVPGAITSLAGHSDDLVVASWDGEIARLRHGVLTWKARWDSTGSPSGTPVLRVAREHGRVLAGLYTGGAVCFQEEDGSILWTISEATGAVKCVALNGDVFAITGRYDPLRVGDAQTGDIHARLPLETPVSDVLAFSPFAPKDRPRLAVAAGDNEVWIVDLVFEGADWRLDLVHRSPGHTLPIKALAWVAEGTVLAGDYVGIILKHRVNCPSAPFQQIACRTGVSSLAFRSDATVAWTTFDGHVGSAPVSDR